MSLQAARDYLCARGYGERVRVFAVSSATVELAAAALNTEPGRIAKSLTFSVGEKAVMILCAGDVKVDNSAYKQQFGCKAKMLSREQVEEMIGHAVGGVCPFGIREGVTVYLDESLKRFDVVYPACGSSNSAVELSLPELEELSGYSGWVSVTKPMI